LGPSPTGIQPLWGTRETAQCHLVFGPGHLSVKETRKAVGRSLLTAAAFYAAFGPAKSRPRAEKAGPQFVQNSQPWEN
jgi:hypothetical protein